MGEGRLYEWDNLILQTCTCSRRRECQTCLAELRISLMTPKKAVDAIYLQDAARPPFLNVLATAVLKDPRYRRSGAAQAFLWYITDHKKAGEDFHWLYPMLGLINILAGIYREQTESKDAATMDLIHSTYGKVLEVIWKDRECILDKKLGDLSEALRMVAAKYICLILCDPETKLYVISFLSDVAIHETTERCTTKRLYQWS